MGRWVCRWVGGLVGAGVHLGIWHTPSVRAAAAAAAARHLNYGGNSATTAQCSFDALFTGYLLPFTVSQQRRQGSASQSGQTAFKPSGTINSKPSNSQPFD